MDDPDSVPTGGEVAFPNPLAFPDPPDTLGDIMKGPSDKILDELVGRIVRSAHPNRVLLFGSAARGQWGDHSDLDVLVVVPDGIHRRRTAQRIYRDLYGFPFATDVVVATESDLVRSAADPSRVYQAALRDGRELYRAA